MFILWCLGLSLLLRKERGVNVTYIYAWNQRTRIFWASKKESTFIICENRNLCYDYLSNKISWIAIWEGYVSIFTMLILFLYDGIRTNIMFDKKDFRLSIKSKHIMKIVVYNNTNVSSNTHRKQNRMEYNKNNIVGTCCSL